MRRWMAHQGSLEKTSDCGMTNEKQFPNANEWRIGMRTLISSISFVVIATLALPLEAQTGAAVVGKGPGVAGAAQTVKVTATITAIDPATRLRHVEGSARQGNHDHRRS